MFRVKEGLDHGYRSAIDTPHAVPEYRRSTRDMSLRVKHVELEESCLSQTNYPASTAPANKPLP